jgi:hypothetical protein
MDFFGVVLIGNSTCIAVEQRGHNIYLLMLDCDFCTWEGVLLEEAELLPYKMVDLRAYELEWSRFDVSKLLVRSLPLLVDVYNVHVIRNRSEQVANVMARLFPQKKLPLYVWSGQQWRMTCIQVNKWEYMCRG